MRDCTGNFTLTSQPLHNNFTTTSQLLHNHFTTTSRTLHEQLHNYFTTTSQTPSREFLTYFTLDVTVCGELRIAGRLPLGWTEATAIRRKAAARGCPTRFDNYQTPEVDRGGIALLLYSLEPWKPSCRTHCCHFACWCLLCS